MTTSIRNTAELQTIADHVAEAYDADPSKPPIEHLYVAMTKQGLSSDAAEALAHKTNQAIYLTQIRKSASLGRPLGTIDASFPLVVASDLVGRLEQAPEDASPDAPKPEEKAAAPVSLPSFPVTRTLAVGLPTKIAAFRRVATGYVTALHAYEARGYDPRVIHKAAAIEAGVDEDAVQDVVERAYFKHTGHNLGFKTADLQVRTLFKQADSAWDMDVNPDALRVQGSWVLPALAVGGTVVTGVAGLATLLSALNTAAEDVGSSLVTN